MRTSEVDIEDDLLEFFNPFVFMAVNAGKTLGGFDIREVNGTHLRFMIFDKRWEDESKTIIWDNYFDCRDYENLIQMKINIGAEIERSIKIKLGF